MGKRIAPRKHGLQSRGQDQVHRPLARNLQVSGRKRRYRRTVGTVDGCRTAGGRSSDGRRTVVGGARVVSGAEKKSFDRGGPVWPPRSNVTNDRLRGGLGGLCPPSQKPGGLGGSAPQPKIFRNISKNFEKNPRDLYFTNALFYYDSPLNVWLKLKVSFKSKQPQLTREHA